VRAIYAQTEGNPLFITEVVRLLAQEGMITPDQDGADTETDGGSSATHAMSYRIPEGVRDVIGRRLNRLSQRCNEVLTIASVIGRGFRLNELAPLSTI
jgi:predicted ATPase